MLTVEIRINGSIINVCNVINEGTSDVNGNHNYTYQGTKFDVDVRKPPVIFGGAIKHKRSDGAEALVEKLMALCAKGK